MNYPDLTNALMEVLSGLFILNHCRVTLKDRAVKGVSILSNVFFTSWGFWNLFYYPHLGQWLSFVGGIFIIAANTYYIGLLMKFRDRKPEIHPDWVTSEWEVGVPGLVGRPVPPEFVGQARKDPAFKTLLLSLRLVCAGDSSGHKPCLSELRRRSVPPSSQ